MRRLRIFTVVQFVFAVSLVGFAFAQSPGEKIVVINEESAVKSGQQIVDTVYIGEILYAGESKGPWIRVESWGGWVLKSSVIPLDQAVEYFTKAIERDPNNAYLYAARAHVWGRSFNEEESGLGETGKAIADFTRAIQLNPSNAHFHFCRAMNYQFENALAKAIEGYTKTIRLVPEWINAFKNRALCWIELGEFDKALEDLNEALKLDPKDAKLWIIRGVAHSNRGEYEKAISNFSEGIRLAPEDPYGLAELAWLYATCSDASFHNGPKAVELATKACELSQWEDAWNLNSLAAAYARIGNFEQAIQWEQKAVDLDPDFGPYQERLALYETGTPFEEAPPTPTNLR